MAEQKRMKPFFPFYGSKYRLAKHYQAPGEETVIEPFAGSACYSVYHGVKNAILVDKDPNIVSTWQYLTQASPQEILDLPTLEKEGDCVSELDLPEGAKNLIGFWLTKGSRPATKRGAYAASDKWRHLFWREDVKVRIASQLERISGWSVIQGGFEQSPILPNSTYFVDPPYQEAGKHYKVQFSDYEKLSEWVTHLPGRVIVCEGAGATWLPFSHLGEFKTFTSGSSPEVIWTNTHTRRGEAI